MLKKPTLDKEELSNYWPISNSSLISKIIKCVIKSRLMDHLTSNSLLNPHQSAYCKHHSTETALLYIHNHLVSAIGSQKVSCLCLLDLSADSTLLTMTSWSPVSHPGLVSMALFSAGSSHIRHLVASVSNVKLTCPPGTHAPAVSPKALSLVLYSSSWTPLLSVHSFPLVP